MGDSWLVPRALVPLLLPCSLLPARVLVSSRAQSEPGSKYGIIRTGTLRRMYLLYRPAAADLHVHAQQWSREEQTEHKSTGEARAREEECHKVLELVAPVGQG